MLLLVFKWKKHARYYIKKLEILSDENDEVLYVGFQAKLKEVASLDGHVLLKKLRDALEYLKGRLAGRNKEDVEKAISLVSFWCYLVLLS